MVAQLLGLKLRLIANIFRRSPWQIVGIVVGLAYGLGAAVALAILLVSLRFSGDLALIRDGLIVGGSLVVAGSLVLPLIFGVDDTMDPRKFALFAMPTRTLSFGLAVSGLIGVPAVALTVVTLSTVVTWSRGIGETVLAIISAALIVATCILASRVSTSIGALLLSSRRSREFSGVFGVLLVLLISPVVVLLVSMDWGTSGLRVLSEFAGILGWTPLGAAWAVPGDAATGLWGSALLKLVIAGGTLGGAWFVWQRLVARMLVTPGVRSQRSSTADLAGSIGFRTLRWG